MRDTTLPGLLALVSFIVALMLGPLVTNLPESAAANWWVWPAIRVGWVFTSAFALIHLLQGIEPHAKRRAELVLLLVSVIFSANPLLDLAFGPWVGVGHRIDFAVHETRYFNRPISSSPAIEGQLVWLREDGEEIVLEAIGIQASRMERAMADCPSGRGRLTVLRHLHVFVSLDCHQFQAIEVRAD
ncbi:MAG: hypothetical protein E6Q42_14665 [Dechloromonas sp.]|nr:MAG: hypothetical protein E6Q42_14665 [Dechloromonas sp.]